MFHFTFKGDAVIDTEEFEYVLNDGFGVPGKDCRAAFTLLSQVILYFDLETWFIFEFIFSDFPFSLFHKAWVTCYKLQVQQKIICSLDNSAARNYYYNYLLLSFPMFIHYVDSDYIQSLKCCLVVGKPKESGHGVFQTTCLGILFLWWSGSIRQLYKRKTDIWLKTCSETVSMLIGHNMNIYVCFWEWDDILISFYEENHGILALHIQFGTWKDNNAGLYRV